MSDMMTSYLPGDAVSFRTGRVDADRRLGNYVDTRMTAKGPFIVVRVNIGETTERVYSVRPANVRAA